MKKLLALAVLVVALVASACGKDDKMTIGSVIFEGTNEWFVEAIAGMEDAAATHDVNLSKSDSRYDILVEQDLIREQIKKKASAIVICPLTVEESGATLSEATKLGIPVVTWNTVVNPPPTAQIVVDSTTLGSATGEYLVKYAAREDVPKLKGAYIIDNTFSIARERCDGFRKSVQPIIDSGKLEVVTEVKCHLYEETVVTVEKLLREYPSINFIWCWNQMTTGATVDVLKRLGRKDIIVAGTDMSLALASEMRDGNVSLVAITTQQPYQMGYQAVECAIKAAKKEKVENTVIVPTITYTKEDKSAIEEYIKTHQKFVRK